MFLLAIAFEMFCIWLVICASFFLWLLSECAVVFGDMQQFRLARKGLRCVASYWILTFIACIGCKLMWPDSVCPRPFEGLTYSYKCPDPWSYVQEFGLVYLGVSIFCLQVFMILSVISIICYGISKEIEWMNSPDEPLVRVHLKTNSV